MTANRDEQGNYRNPLRPNHGPYISVTTALSAGVPKNLDNWHKLTVAEYAVDNHAAWTQLDRDAAVALIKAASDRKRDSAGARGTVAHEVLEVAASGQRVGRELEGDAAGYIDAGLLFLAQWQPEIRYAEVEVFSDTHRYAGTFDLLAWVAMLGVGILDWKSGKRIYPEVGLQLAAYRNADYALVGGAEVAIPPVDFGAALHLHDDGTYDVIPVECGDTEFELFLHALEVARWTRGGNAKMVGKPLPTPGINLVAERAAWLTLRVAAIRDTNPAALDALAARWPIGVPTLREGGHTPAQLDLIGRAISDTEGQFSLPFPPADPGSERMQAVEIDPLVNRANMLPADLLDAVNEAARNAGVPHLRSGRITRAHFELVGELVEDAEAAAALRASGTAEMVASIAAGSEREPAIRAACGVIGNAWTSAALGKLRALHAACEAGALVFTEDGGLLVSNAEGRLVERYGTKRDALAAMKLLAEQFGETKPRSVADAAANPALVALALPYAA